MIDIRSLKAFIRKNLEENSILREVILEENDYLGINDFLTALKLWLKVLDAERSGHSRKMTNR